MTNAIAPTFTPASGAVPIDISIVSAGNQIFYTTNGDTPTTNLTSVASGTLVSVTSTNHPLRALAWFADGYRNPSTVTEAYYTNAPAFEYFSTQFAADAMTKTTLTGAGQSKVGTFSTWVRFTGGDASAQEIFSSLNAGKTVAPYRIYRNASGQLYLDLYNAAGTRLLLAYTDLTTFTSSAGWLHLMASWDLDNGVYQFKVNGTNAAVTVSVGPVDDYVPFASGQLFYVGDYDGGNSLDALLCETWFTTEYVTDVSKFYSAGAPVSLGANGSTPTGTQPLVYLPNPYSSFQTNAGSGGDFTVSTGTLADGGVNKP